MDVTCERCGTEYEFDETLLSGRGTSVKCTNCGYVFKVYPKDRAGTGPVSHDWRLRRSDGSTDVIDSLRELQRRIGAGELTPADEIARGDEGWKSLGSIPELETFFRAAGVPMPPRTIQSPLPPAAPGPTTTERGTGSTPLRRPRQPTLLGVPPVQRLIPVSDTPGPRSESEPASVPVPASEPASASASVSASEPASVPAPASASMPASVPAPVPKPAPAYQSPYSSDSAPPDVLASWSSRSEIEDAEFEERPRSSASASTRLSAPPPPYYDDDDDIPDLPGPSSSPLRWLLLFVVVGALALIGTQWERVARLLGLGSNAAQIAAGVAEGDAGLAEGHAQGYASAIEAYRQSIDAGGDHDPEILSKLSKAYALSAQVQIDDGGVGVDSGSFVASALELARSAIEEDPQNLDALLAEADALRLAGEYAESRRVLDRARALSFTRTAELYRIDARLSAAEAGGGLEHGLRSAKQAVELAPHGVPYLLLLARAERAAGDTRHARVALETVLADHPEHPIATRLLAELATAAAEVADAGIAEDAGAEADAGAEPVPASEPASESMPAPEAAPESESAPEPASAPVPASVPAPEPAVEEPAVEPEDAGTTAAGTAAKAKPVVKQAPPKPSAPRKRVAPKRPAYDEYDQLTKAAGDDAFVDGRPPVRDYEWYMREGRAELAGGNYSRARAFFDGALEVRPGSADAMDGLGKVSTRIEDYDAALRYFRAAAQRGQPDGYFNLGKTYERLGQNEEAVSAYYTYLKRYPSGAHADVARLTIKSLEPHATLPPEPDPSPAEAPAQEPEPIAP